MRKKQTDEPDTIIDPAYWHLLPEERRKALQTELEDTLEAALDEGEPIEADDKFWANLRAEVTKKIAALETAKERQ